VQTEVKGDRTSDQMDSRSVQKWEQQTSTKTTQPKPNQRPSAEVRWVPWAYVSSGKGPCEAGQSH